MVILSLLLIQSGKSNSTLDDGVTIDKVFQGMAAKRVGMYHGLKIMGVGTLQSET